MPKVWWSSIPRLDDSRVRSLPRPHPYRSAATPRTSEPVGRAFQGGGPAFSAEDLPDGLAAEVVAVAAGADPLDIEAVADDSR